MSDDSREESSRPSFLLTDHFTWMNIWYSSSRIFPDSQMNTYVNGFVFNMYFELLFLDLKKKKNLPKPYLTCNFSRVLHTKNIYFLNKRLNKGVTIPI